jgi:hypothetical protein
MTVPDVGTPLNWKLSSGWSRRVESNNRPAPYEGAALPLSYTGVGETASKNRLLRRKIGFVL